MNDSILDKIRKLLALAEGASTTEEADAASAAAERLIQKYSVDLAVLQEARGDKGRPTTRVVKIPAPYLQPKATLLNVIARHNGCQAIYSPQAQAVTLVGFEGDLESVDLLFASLLLQATSAAMRAQPADGRTRAFRNAFLLGFAGTVNARLAAARRDVVESTPGAALVLRDRSDEVAAHCRELFPRTRQGRVSSSHYGGRAAGSAAASRADLGQRRMSGAGQRAIG